MGRALSWRGGVMVAVLAMSLVFVTAGHSQSAPTPNQHMAQEFDRLRRSVAALNSAVHPNTHKDVWDKLNAVSGIVAAVAVAVLGLFATGSYNKRQLRAKEVEIVGTFIPHLTSDDPKRKEAALVAMSGLGITRVVVQLADTFRDAPSYAAVNSITQGSDPGAAKVARAGLEALGGAPSVSLSRDDVTDFSGDPLTDGVIDSELGVTFSGSLTLPNWLAGAATIQVWLDEPGGPIDHMLPTVDLTLMPTLADPEPKTYRWQIMVPPGVLPRPTDGPVEVHALGKFIYEGQDTDIAGFSDLGTYKLR